MKIFDAHCDTLSAGHPLWSNDGHFDFARALRRGGGAQVMAAFGKRQDSQLHRLADIQGAYQKVLAEGDTTLQLIPALEGADSVSSVEDAQRFLDLGVRCFGLTWNHDNALGGGCAGTNGLTPLGRDVIALCQEQHVTVDLAHASKQSFGDALGCSATPMIVSHTCMDALRSHERNLDDTQLRALAQAGGVAGITFYCPFLEKDRNCTIDSVIQHILYAINTAGEDAVGIGSDYDGCDALPPGLESTEALPELIERIPVSDRVREKIAYCNFARVLVY